MQQSVGILLYMFQLPVQPPVAYFVQHFLYRGENQGEWGTQLMGNVDEET